MAKIYSQLEKAQLENTTSDTGSLPKGMITYRTDLNIAKVSNGTSMLALIDESSTQTLSGKTYATPNFTGAFNMAQTTTPANPSAGNNKFYFKADGKLYTLDSSGNEALVGSGTGGVKNLITNGNADDTAASIFVPYADTGTRPVDGTGGSPTVTTSMTTSTPLDGAKSFLLTKPASNVQGQGWAVPFTVDPAYRAKSLKISVDYIVNSGTFVAGGAGVESDVIWYIYDVTNSQLIEPSNIKMLSNSSTISDKFEATFQTSATGASYRLIAHCQSTSALAYELKVDNVSVGPQTYVFGTPVTDWTSWTPTGSWTTNTTYTGFKRRVGSDMEYKVGITLSGAPNAVGLSINLPPGEVIDTSKTLSTSAGFDFTLGQSNMLDAGNANYIGGVAYNSTTSVQVLALNAAGTFLRNDGQASQTTPFTWGSGDMAFIGFRVPIVGLSSSVQMSDTTDTRIVAASIRLDIARSIPNTTATKINFQSSGMLFDTHGAFDYTNDRYIAQMAGKFKFSGWAGFDANASGIREISYKKNGGASQYISSAPSFGTYTQSVPYSFLEDLNAGDYIEIYVFQSSGAALNLFANGSVLNVEKISGPSQIAANEKLIGYGSCGNAQSVPNATYTTLAIASGRDTHGIIDSTNNWLKIQTADDYFIEAHTSIAGNTVGTREFKAQFSTDGGSIWNDFVIDAKVANAIDVATAQFTKIRYFNSGTLIRFVYYQNSGGSLSMVSDGSQNYFGIMRVK